MTLYADIAQQPVVLPDGAITLNQGEANRRLVIKPTATRIITLPSVGIIAGDIVQLHNLAASEKITPESSDGDDIASFQNGAMSMMALQAAPTDRTHWRILDVFGGANPSFHGHRTSSQFNIGTGFTKIRFTAKLFDTNDNFAEDAADTDVGGILSRFTPTVPGKYEIFVNIQFTPSDAHHLEVNINKNSDGHIFRDNPGSTANHSTGGSILLDMDGLTDYAEIAAANTTSADTIGGSITSTWFMGMRISL